MLLQAADQYALRLVAAVNMYMAVLSLIHADKCLPFFVTSLCMLLLLADQSVLIAALMVLMRLCVRRRGQVRRAAGEHNAQHEQHAQASPNLTACFHVTMEFHMPILPFILPKSHQSAASALYSCGIRFLSFHPARPVSPARCNAPGRVSVS